MERGNFGCFLEGSGAPEVVSEEPQPGLLRVWFGPTERVKSSPEGAPDEQPCDDVVILVSLRSPWQNIGGVYGGKENCCGL